MKNRQWSTVLFWGALWGISEATVSYLLHLVAPGFGWFFYYPLAYAFMYGVYRQSGKAGNILWTAALSATIKLINLFMTPRIDYVINPAVSILLEGLIMFCAVRIFSRQNKPIPSILGMTVITSFCWRCLYLLYLLAMPAWIRDASVLRDAGLLFHFLLVETAANAALIYAGAIVVRTRQRTHAGDSRAAFWVPERVFSGISVAVFGVSVFLQWAL